MELAIDTSTDFASISLSNEGGVIAELTWHAVQKHTIELVPNIDYLLKQTGIVPEFLNAVYVARGPGSFNGLRVAMSTAKGLVFALRVPLISISTLEIEAYPFSFSKLLVCPIQSSGRNELATAFYRQDDEWRCLKEAYITTIDELCHSIEETTIFCGEIPDHLATHLLTVLGNRAIMPNTGICLRRAGYMAALGWQRLKRGEQDNPATIQPTYLRQPPITKRKVK